MPLSDEATSEQVQLALAALTNRFSIVTKTEPVASRSRGEYIIAHLDCGCRRSEQRQKSNANQTLLQCTDSLGELIEKKHAECIAARAAEVEAAAAAAAHREGQRVFGTMMAASAAISANERRQTELLAARELVKSSKQAAAAAEELAEAARRAEVEAAEPFRAPRIAAESEAAKLAAEMAAARSALAELESEAKRACGEQAEAEPAEPKEPVRQWGLGTYRTQEKWAEVRRAVPITEGAKQVEMRRGDERGYMHHPRRGLIGAVQDWAAGSRANVVKIMLRLIRWFGVEGDVREKLGAEQSRAAKLDTEIVDRAAAALDLLKPCANLEQTHNYKVPTPRLPLPSPSPYLPLPLPLPLTLTLTLTLTLNLTLIPSLPLASPNPHLKLVAASCALAAARRRGPTR